MYDVCETFSAKTVLEALTLQREHHGAVIVAGGTDVMIRMKERKLTEATLISIMEVEELKFICLDGNGNLLIGPGVCFDHIYNSDLVRRCTPMLAYACNEVGSPQIRHVATIGGNLCNGAVSADSVPSLLALGAELTLTSPFGERTVPAIAFHTGPGKTVLDRDREILTCIRIPKANFEGHGGKYLKFGQRNAMEISTLGCAVNCKLDADGTISDFAIAFGVAAPKPVRCPKAEAGMIGKIPTEALLSELKQAVLTETSPRDSWRASKELRVQLIKELAARAAAAAIIEAGGKLQ
ncbi:MAG: xanthine dehydrogenase FAD-binding subunit XdhB [Clostridia bacterium]|nr:xanthine dehydrogenase FAD-binding subunit XdhB [Clostridia bacterium]